jgi:NADPH:quinone reductase-like Zn-dependent oxidoreductase
VRSNQSAERLQSALPGPPVYSTSDSNWKEQVREALGGHKLEVAFDAIGGKAIDDLAEVVDDGGTIINFGSLDSNMGTNIYSLAPNNVAHEYEFADFQKAIHHASSPVKTGIVLLKSPI